jgi:hypothetical protein
MAGTAGRSGGRNKKATIPAGDGSPCSPRVLSPRASVLFGWLIDKLKADDPGSQWSRIDGTILASLSELLESQEHVASQLADNPASVALMRVRIQLAGQISRMSAIIGLTPIDRKRQPVAVPTKARKDPFTKIMERMAKG